MFLLFWKKGPEDTRLTVPREIEHGGPKFPAFAPILFIVQCTTAGQFYWFQLTVVAVAAKQQEEEKSTIGAK